MPRRASVLVVGLLVFAGFGSALPACDISDSQPEEGHRQTAPPSAAASASSERAGASGAAAASAPNGATGTNAANGAPSTTAASEAPSGSASPKSPAVAADPGAAERVAALAKEPPRPADGKGAGFVGPVDIKLDGEWITRMASDEIVEITPNKGGSSVSMRVKFKDGKKAALKPEQTGRPTNPRSEIAAYHVDRLLGFGRTAAVVGRRFAMEDLRAALVASKAESAFLERLDKLVVKDGHVDAALIAWHTAPLVEEEVSPPWITTLDTRDPVGKEAISKVAEWSDLVVFDWLVNNPDRYSGGNILRLGKDGPLVFLDQGAAFAKAFATSGILTKDRQDRTCRFRRETLAALRKVGSGAAKEGSLSALLKKSLARDPIAPVLDAGQLAGVDERVKAIEEHVRACSAKLGDASVLAAAAR